MTTKSSGLNVDARKDEEGNVQLGVEVDGTWVPFVTKNAGYIEHLTATYKAAAEQAKSEE